MNKHIHWEKVGLLTVVMLSVAIVAFVMSKSVGRDERGVSQSVSVAPVVVSEKMTLRDNVYTNTKKVINQSPDETSRLKTYYNEKYGFEFQYPKQRGDYIVREKMSSDDDPIPYIEFSLPTSDPSWIKSGLKEYVDMSVWIYPGVYNSPDPCKNKVDCVPGFVERVVARDTSHTYSMLLQVQSRPGDDYADDYGFADLAQSFRLMKK